MLLGIINSQLIESSMINIYDINKGKAHQVAKEYGVIVCKNEVEVVKNSDIIILAVKPNTYDGLMFEIKDYISSDKVVISIAAGKCISDMQEILGSEAKIVRTMPNTPALVNEGMSALCPNDNITDIELHYVRKIFESFGKAEVVEEKLIDSVIGISGSSPAYVFMFIEAMADAAVLGGMTRDKAYKFAAQALIGSAKMVLETDKHPGELKDMVCSPGGTTIEAVRTLEANGFRSAIIEAIVSCMNKSKEMTKKNNDEVLH